MKPGRLPAIVWSSSENNGSHENEKEKETQPMKKLTVRYIRYALVLLANVGFKLSMN
jgi:hypothetical protein